MPTIQILAILLGFIVAGAVFFRSWQPEAWWFNSVETFLKAGVAFVAVVGAIWLVTQVGWERGAVEDGKVVAETIPTATVIPEPSPTTPPMPTVAPLPPSPTSVPPAPTQIPPTPTEMVPTPTVATVHADSGRTEIYLDMGNCDGQPDAPAGACPGEFAANYVGWGSAKGPWSGMPFAAGGDATLRDMSLGADNLIILDRLAPVDFLLTLVTGDGACDDSFQIVIGDRLAYEYQARDPGVQTFETHVIPIPLGAIQDGRLTIIVRNIATDGCGLAGVFNVSLVAQ
jgi:hypothetical protein